MIDSSGAILTTLSSAFIIITAISIGVTKRKELGKPGSNALLVVSIIFGIIIISLTFALQARGCASPAVGTAGFGLVGVWEPVPANVVFERYVPFTMRLTFNAEIVALPKPSNFQPVAEAVVAVDETNVDVTLSFDTVGQAVVGMFADNAARGIIGGKIVKTENASVQQPINILAGTMFLGSFLPSNPVPAGEKFFIEMITNSPISKLPQASEFVPAALNLNQTGTNTLRIFFIMQPGRNLNISMIDPNSMTNHLEQRLSNKPATSITVYGPLDASITTTETDFSANVDFILSYKFTNPLKVLPLAANFSVSPTLIAEGTDSDVVNVTFNVPANPDLVIILSEHDNPCQDIYEQFLTNDIRSQHLTIT